MVRNLSKMVHTAKSFELMIFFFEIILLGFEINLVIPLSILEKEQKDYLEIIRSNLIYRIAVNFDMETQVAKFVKEFIWAGLLILIIILSYLCSSLFQEFELKLTLKRRNDYLQTMDNRILSLFDFQRITTSIIYSYGYWFYFIGIYCFGYFMCVKKVEIKSLISHSELFEVLPPYTNTLLEKNKREQSLMWIYGDSRCFGGEYYISVFFSTIALLFSFFLRFVNEYLLSYYPSTEIIDTKSSKVDLLNTVGFFFLRIFKHFIVIYEVKFFENAYFWMTFGVYLFIFLMNAIRHPIFNETLQKIRILRLIIILYVCAWMLALRNSTVYSHSKMIKNDFSLIIFSLAIPATFRFYCSMASRKIIDGSSLIEEYDESGVHHNEPQKLVSRIRLVNLVFDIERVRTYLEKGVLSDSDQLNIRRVLTEMHKISKSHKRYCQSSSCDCRKRNSLEPGNLDKNSWWSEAVRTVSIAIEGKLADYQNRKKKLTNSKYFQILRLWCIYSIRHDGNCKKVIELISKSFQQDVQKLKKSSGSLLDRFSKKFSYQYNLLQLDVLKSIIETDIKSFEKDQANYLVSKVQEMKETSLMNSHPEEIRTRISSKLIFYPVIEYLAVFSKALSLLKKVIDSKKMCLEGFSSKRLNIQERVPAYIHSCNEFRATISQLDSLSEIKYYMTKLIEIYYLQNIREDFQTSRSRWVELRSKQVDNNLSALASLDNKCLRNMSNLVFCVSGESSNLHQIVLANGHLIKIGFSPGALLGEDLKRVLPSCVNRFHKEALSSSSYLNYKTQRASFLQMFIKKRDGFIKPAEIAYRVDSSIGEGDLI